VIPALAPGEILPLTRRQTGAPDPLALFGRLTNDGTRPHTLLLESADTTTGVGDRSVLVVSSSVHIVCRGSTVVMRALTPNGIALLPWIADRLADRVVARDRECVRLEFPIDTASGTDERTRLLRPSPLDAIRAIVQGPRLATSPLDLSHFAAGVISFDLLELYEPLGGPRPLSDADTPHYEFWLADRFLVVDHRRQMVTIAACVYGGDDLEARYHDAARDVERLSGTGNWEPGTGGSVAIAGSPAAAADLSDDEFAAVVERLKAHIVAGDVFQIVPSRTFRTPCPAPLRAYGMLRRSNPSPYMFYVCGERFTLFGASPETCVKVTGDPKRVILRPIAGTAARGLTADGRIDEEVDARREAALRLDAKEAAEHLMLVDLARNDVARVSRPGTRRVTKLLTVERYSRVMHLVSEVEGVLDGSLDALHAYAASMNMGTLVGAPKVRAAQLLREVERTPRGPYGGAVGYFSASGEFDTAIVIRSALVRQGEAQVRAGAGIVLDSDPQSEALETKRKADAVLRAIAAAGEPRV
jgi:anthranilate synthase component I